MPEPYVELPEDEFDPVTDLQEVIDDRSPSSRSCSRHAQEAIAKYLLDSNKERSFARWMLGFDRAGVDGDYRLYREPPQAHPTMPWLYAESVNFESVAPKPNPAFDNKPQEYSLFPTLGIERVARYTKSIATVRYTDPGNMRFLADSDIDDYTDEWKRFTRWHTRPLVEALQADGSSQLIFAESGAPGFGPTAGATAFPAPIAILLAKCEFVLEWSAPHEYLSTDPQILIPARLLDCMGKVNSTDFLGVGLYKGASFTNFPAGTLLMDPPTFESFSYPVMSTDQYQPLIGWRVYIPFRRFDPEKGVPTSTYRGHNLMPWRGGGTVLGLGDPNAGKWFYATRSGDAPGRPLLQSAEFLDIFKHVNQP